MAEACQWNSQNPFSKLATICDATEQLGSSNPARFISTLCVSPFKLCGKSNRPVILFKQSILTMLFIMNKKKFVLFGDCFLYDGISLCLVNPVLINDGWVPLLLNMISHFLRKANPCCNAHKVTNMHPHIHLHDSVIGFVYLLWTHGCACVCWLLVWPCWSDGLFLILARFAACPIQHVNLNLNNASLMGVVQVEPTSEGRKYSLFKQL